MDLASNGFARLPSGEAQPHCQRQPEHRRTNGESRPSLQRNHPDERLRRHSEQQRWRRRRFARSTGAGDRTRRRRPAGQLLPEQSAIQYCRHRGVPARARRTTLFRCSCSDGSPTGSPSPSTTRWRVPPMTCRTIPGALAPTRRPLGSATAGARRRAMGVRYPPRDARPLHLGSAVRTRARLQSGCEGTVAL